MTNLIFPVGIPGSGKSTWARTMLGHGKYAIVSSDDIRREQWGSLRAAHDVDPEEKKARNEIVWKIFYKRVEDNLSHGVDAYADGTNLTSHARSRLREIAGRTRADLHVIVFDNIIQALSRNVEREHDLVVPKDVMDKFLKNYATSYREILKGNDVGWYSSVTVIESLR